ncbi:MAG: oxidoreductase [Anaerolineaceae bacterium]|nr:oxidoreductase [Anaerolineaceae bacterium]
MAEQKPKLALYWASSCGGCEISVLAIHEKILDVAAAFDIVFWPCAMDFKEKDVEAMADGEIDVCLFNGAIRNDENAHMAHLMRRKSKVLVAYGSCAMEGCMPGLANFTDREHMMRFIYHDSPSTDNPDGVEPQIHTVVPEGELTLPAFWNTVKTLDQVVPVDYYLPGCPPEAKWTIAAVEAIISGQLPPPGSVIGMNVTVCDECNRTRSEKRIKQFYRPYEIIPDPEICLLDQGLFCAGIATRAGCGALCPQVNMGCRGCYGPNEGVVDGGAKLISALASVVDAETPEEIDAVFDTLPDPAGYFYRFNLAHSLLRRTHLVGSNGTRVAEKIEVGPQLDPKLKD